MLVGAPMYLKSDFQSWLQGFKYCQGRVVFGLVWQQLRYIIKRAPQRRVIECYNSLTGQRLTHNGSTAS